MSENLPAGGSEREARQTDDTQLVEAEPLTEEAAVNLRLQSNPYLPDAPRRRVAVMTPAKKRKFCVAVANGSSPTSAAKALGVARSTVYYQRSIDPEFAEAWAEAQERDADRYEDALEHLATKSRNVGAVIFGLKNRRPDKWKDKHEIVQRSVSVHISLPAATEAELLAMVQERLAKGQALLPAPASQEVNICQ